MVHETGPRDGDILLDSDVGHAADPTGEPSPATLAAQVSGDTSFYGTFVELARLLETPPGAAFAEQGLQAALRADELLTQLAESGARPEDRSQAA